MITSTTYNAVHKRLKRVYGPARDYQCIKCGVRAAEWAYQHVSVLIAPDLRHRDRTFPLYGSPDLNDYAPMCRKCHSKMDWPYTQGGQLPEVAPRVDPPWAPQPSADPRALEYFNEYWATRPTRLAELRERDGQEQEDGMEAMAGTDLEWLNYLAAHDPAAFAKLPA